MVITQPMPLAAETRSDRYAWIDFAKGFCILAVVALWGARSLEGVAGWMGYVVAFSKPFRMPDFFLISGLFLSQVIDRPWRSYLDTKVVHYVYFFVLWSLLLVPLTWFTSGTVPDTGVAMVQSWLYSLYKPVAMLWFIQLLPLFFVVARWVRSVSAVWVLLLSAIWMAFGPKTEIYPIDEFGAYFVFFYAGYVGAQHFFALADWTQNNRWRAWAVLGMWIGLNAALVKFRWHEAYTVVSLALGFTGISALVMLARLISHWPAAQWLNALGRQSIVVYLGFYAPMQLTAPWWLSLPISPHARAVGVLVCSVGGAWLMYHLCLRCGLGFLYQRPDWARLTPPPQAVLSVSRPAAP